jgi:hypothetical protein
VLGRIETLRHNFSGQIQIITTKVTAALPLLFHGPDIFSNTLSGPPGPWRFVRNPGGFWRT